MSNDVISIEELTLDRTPEELFTWIENKMNHIESTDEGEKSLRLHEGLAKQLIEEVYPLAIFGKHKFGNTDQILLKPVIGNQKYDAVVTDLRSKPPFQSYIEITQSHEGENDYLRRRVLQEQGFLFIPTHVTKKGTKKTGLGVSVKPNANSGEVPGKELNRIVDAARRKAGKDYPTDTSLIIVFDDDHFFKRHVNNSSLDTFVRKYVMNLNLRFAALYLVGRREEVFREFSLSN